MSSKQWEGGKGSQRRGDSDEQYRSNWDRIFGGIDYADKDLKQSLYHSSEEGISLQRPQDFDQLDPYTVLTDNNNLTNGENK